MISYTWLVIVTKAKLGMNRNPHIEPKVYIYIGSIDTWVAQPLIEMFKNKHIYSYIAKCMYGNVATQLHTEKLQLVTNFPNNNFDEHIAKWLYVHVDVQCMDSRNFKNQIASYCSYRYIIRGNCMVLFYGLLFCVDQNMVYTNNKIIVDHILINTECLHKKQHTIFPH